jgi:hypothetical protein
MLEEARRVIAALPADEAGTCVLRHAGDLYRGSAETLAAALQRQEIAFHHGRIRGALPQIVDRRPQR